MSVVTTHVTSVSAIFTHCDQHHLSHLECTRGYGNLLSQISLRVYWDIGIAVRGSLSLLIKSFTSHIIYIYIYIYLVFRARMELLFKIYLFYCNPVYCSTRLRSLLVGT